MYADTETGLILHRGQLTRSRFAVRVVQLLDVAFAFLALLLAARFVVEYGGARPVNPALAWLHQVTTEAALPFARVPVTHDPAGHPLVWKFVVALVAYGIVYRLVVGAVRRLARPRAEPIDFD